MSSDIHASEMKKTLIELVRKYECLYNPRSKKYKNNAYRTMLWEKIGAALSIKGSKAKEIWRSLRDGYIRYKKHTSQQSLTSRKYTHYNWTSQMAFLDETIELRLINANSSPKAEFQASESQIPSSSFETYFIEPRSPGNFICGSPPRDVTSNTNSNVRSDRTAQLLEYLVTEQKKDTVDYLFASYAATFKNMSKRKQIELKLVLAKLFADAELSEMDEEVTNEPQRSPVYLSSAYSVKAEKADEQSPSDVQPNLVEPTRHFFIAKENSEN